MIVFGPAAATHGMTRALNTDAQEMADGLNTLS